MIVKSQSFIREDGNFIPVDEYIGILNDTEYVEGAIELSIDNIILLDKDMWDHVDDLWSYILWGIEELSCGNEYVTGFPDQPIEFHIKPIADQLAEFRIDYGIGRNVRVNRREFIDIMLAEAERFFTHMRGISLRSNGNDYTGELEKILKIRNSL